ncbi:MAG TPA: type II secretion system protein [Clostridiaceae bacterium]
MKKNFKKKGFTLIELIAVIAILAILGAILVPKVLGYQTKAKKSNLQASAKTMVHAIQAYNADKTDAAVPVVAAAIVPTGVKAANDNTVKAAVEASNLDNGGVDSTINTSNASYTTLSTKTVAELCEISNSNFTLSSAGVISNIKAGGDIAN